VEAEPFTRVIDAARLGRDWAWRALYDDVAGSVLGYLRAQGSREPEDRLGEVFLDLARNLGRFQGDAAAWRSWVFTVAHHRLLDERRRRRRRPVEPLPRVPEHVAGDVEEEAMANLGTEEARALLEELTPDQRDVVLLRVFADLDLEETARVLSKPVGAVKALQHRALAALRRRLASARPYPPAATRRLRG
jgi:RNA polymerase sigma factor, sigma-70 family